MRLIIKLLWYTNQCKTNKLGFLEIPNYETYYKIIRDQSCSLLVECFIAILELVSLKLSSRHFIPEKVFDEMLEPTLLSF